MKSFIAMAFVLCAAMVSAEPPVMTELPEIPAKYCGTFYLHGKIDPDGKFDHFSPAKPFGRIEAKQVMFDDGKLLKITTIEQTEMDSRWSGNLQHQQVIIVRFEETDFTWAIGAGPDSTFSIAQSVFNWDPTKMRVTMFIVSQNKDYKPNESPNGKKLVTVTQSAPSYPPPPFTGEVEIGMRGKPKEAYYIDCWPDSVVLLPGTIKVTWEELQQPTNALAKFLDDVQQRNLTTYAVVIARPDSVKVFRQVRKMIGARSIDCGYEVLATNVPLELYSQPASSFRTPPMAHTGSKLPVFFECRAGQVFYIDKVELDEKVEKMLYALSPHMRSGDPNGFVRAINSNEVGNAYYKVMPSYLLAMIMAIEPKPGVRGDDSNSIKESSSKFQSCLKKCNPNTQHLLFLVRSDSFSIFRQAREIADQLGFDVNFEILNDGEPIKFGNGGSVVPTK